VFTLDIDIKRHHTNVTTSALLTDWYQYSRLLDYWIVLEMLNLIENSVLNKSSYFMLNFYSGQSPNLMNLSRVSHPPTTAFQLNAGLNLEILNTILSGTNHI